jgi:hypothetical protein
MRRRDNDLSEISIPAAVRWFIPGQDSTPTNVSLSEKYLSPFGETILPYELIIEKDQSLVKTANLSTNYPEMYDWFNRIHADASPGPSFHRFNQPLNLFLHICRDYPKLSPQLYIAQAQITDLPKPLQDDLPAPRLVKEAGKGDVYDANIWMGIPPTYTPLHKDPNPNLFIQLAGNKRVRLFRPKIGLEIFRDVQYQVGQSASSIFRGEEMMEGPERAALEDGVWGSVAPMSGFEAVVHAGDALFIPKGWWHSIKSVGTGINASVNWWFR